MHVLACTRARRLVRAMHTIRGVSRYAQHFVNPQPTHQEWPQGSQAHTCFTNDASKPATLLLPRAHAQWTS